MEHKILESTGLTIRVKDGPIVCVMNEVGTAWQSQHNEMAAYADDIVSRFNAHSDLMGLLDNVIKGVDIDIGACERLQVEILEGMSGMKKTPPPPTSRSSRQRPESLQG